MAPSPNDVWPPTVCGGLYHVRSINEPGGWGSGRVGGCQNIKCTREKKVWNSSSGHLCLGQVVFYGKKSNFEGMWRRRPAFQLKLHSPHDPSHLCRFGVLLHYPIIFIRQLMAIWVIVSDCWQNDSIGVHRRRRPNLRAPRRFTAFFHSYSASLIFRLYLYDLATFYKRAGPPSK